jgi:ketosteroid isomerase-like protein
MSEKNVEIVRRIFEAAANRDSEAVLALYDPGVQVDVSRAPCRDLVGSRFYHGHDGLRSYFREWYEAWETVVWNVEELIDAGERVISVETEQGRGRASGAAVEMHMSGIWTIRGGKVVRVEWLEGRDPAEARDEALKAVELRE